MARALAVAGLLGAAAGHGQLTMPISRSLRNAVKRTAQSLRDDTNPGLSYAGECPGGTACTWYNQKVTTPLKKATNCDPRMRTLGVSCDSKNPIDWPCSQGHGGGTPWCAPGTAQVKSPCGIFSGGWGSNGRDMRDIDDTPVATWEAGSVVDVAWAVTANHGGGYAYRLCNKDTNPMLEEECFQANHLEYADEQTSLLDPAGKAAATFPAHRTSVGTWPVNSTWTRNPIPMDETAIEPIPGLPHVNGRGPFNFSISDKVRVPAGLPPGRYALSWRWEAEQNKQVWAQCSDVIITNKGQPMPPAPTPGPLPSGRKHVCTGDSLGLDVNDCDAWVEVFDSMGGATWPFAGSCPGHVLRTDPCGCNHVYQKFIRCNAKRDLLRITEVYFTGPGIVGTIPDAISKLPLVALSMGLTRLSGTVPPSLGENTHLEMLWLDGNPLLSGSIPDTFVGLSKQLSAFEMHDSNFTGKLPAMAFNEIADCTLNNLVFDCPLPEGAENCGATCK